MSIQLVCCVHSVERSTLHQANALSWRSESFLSNAEQSLNQSSLYAWYCVQPLIKTGPGKYKFDPADTLRSNDVGITSKRRHFEVITSKWHRFNVISTLLPRHFSMGMYWDIAGLCSLAYRLLDIKASHKSMPAYCQLYPRENKAVKYESNAYCNSINQYMVQQKQNMWKWQIRKLVHRNYFTMALWLRAPARSPNGLQWPDLKKG